MKMLRCLTFTACLLLAALAMPAMAEPIADNGPTFELVQPSLDTAVGVDIAPVMETAQQNEEASLQMNTLRTPAPRTSIRSGLFVNASPTGKTYKLRC